MLNEARDSQCVYESSFIKVISAIVRIFLGHLCLLGNVPNPSGEKRKLHIFDGHVEPNLKKIRSMTLLTKFLAHTIRGSGVPPSDHPRNIRGELAGATAGKVGCPPKFVRLPCMRSSSLQTARNPFRPFPFFFSPQQNAAFWGIRGTDSRY